MVFNNLTSNASENKMAVIFYFNLFLVCRVDDTFYENYIFSSHFSF